MFNLSPKEWQKIHDWQAGHEVVYCGAIGGRYTYTFTPTSLGIIIKVKDAITKTELDLSEYEHW